MIFAIAAIAMARSEEPGFPGLESNERYINLKRQNEQLLAQEDSIQLIIRTIREEFTQKRDADSIVSQEFIDSFTSDILALEQQIFDIRQLRGDVITELNDIEQEYIIANMYNSSADVEEITAENTDSTEVVAPVQHRTLIKNEIFRNTLSTSDYAELELAAERDKEMISLCSEYTKQYQLLAITAHKYRETKEESVADSLFKRYEKLKEECETLNDDIETAWNQIIDTKYFAYNYILEKQNRHSLIESASTQFVDMQHRCSEEDGIYASDAVMHYALGYPTLLDFEVSLAREIELTEALDSLQDVRTNIYVPEYRNEPIDLERRLFIDYTPITFGRTNHYNNSNPLPALKVYERGTIYRILLGTFRTKQPMTLFKGVQPLFIAQNEEKNYCYYAGGYATLKEAEEAQLMLKKKGFKRPEICRWRDGEMINIDSHQEQTVDGQSVTPMGQRYIVTLKCETISEELRAAITAAAPEKPISRRGTSFAIGTFTDLAEAEALVTTIEEQFDDIEASVVELDL